MSPPRIVSLIASATEIVYALGCGEWLVGRSHECDYPPAVSRLPICTSSRVEIDAAGVEIDRQIKALLQSAVSIYNLDTEALNRLRPDLIITQSQCEVCAVSLHDVERAICGLVGSRPKIVSLEPNSLADIWTGVEEVARALGVPERGVELVGRLKQRLSDLEKRVAQAGRRPTVACIEWIDPLMAAGNWVPELVEIAGGVNLFGESGKHSPWMTWEELVARDPEVIVAMPCGWGIARCRAEMSPLTDRPVWSRLSAVRHGRVYLTDGNQYFNRPGPRVVESAEILAEILHPGEIHYSHEGTGWAQI